MQNAEKMCIFPTHLKDENNKKYGCIYFCKIINYKKDVFYKIGMSRNIKNRLLDLEKGHAGHYGKIILLATGITDNMPETEFKMHQKFFKYHYSFVYDAGIPKWSNEYFDLNYYKVCEVIKELRKRCWDVNTVVTTSKDIKLPLDRMIPYHLHDLGYWEYRELKCRCRSVCIGDDCITYDKCRSDIKYSICD